MLRQLAQTFLQIIIPEPSFEQLRRMHGALRRHMHEPPRRRDYQKMPRVF